MSFIEGSIALADRLGMTPDDVYILFLFCLIFWCELGGFMLLMAYRLICRLFRWFRSRRKKAAD